MYSDSTRISASPDTSLRAVPQPCPLLDDALPALLNAQQYEHRCHYPSSPISTLLLPPPDVGPLSARPLNGLSDLRIRLVTNPSERAEILLAIAARFGDKFGATVTDDTQYVAVVEAPSAGAGAAMHRIAAFGLTTTTDAFFCRQYLGDVDTALCAHFPNAAEARLIELSHLVVFEPATTIKVLQVIGCFLSASHDILVCTVTQKLARIFRCRRYAFSTLARADASQLSNHEREQWGEYYEHDPIVVAGALTPFRQL